MLVTSLETDFCIAQSAIHLVNAGYRVWAADDATTSPGPHHDAGLNRMRGAGVGVSGIKGIYYE
ncbi:MAG TPA: hypothetical protein DHW07_04215 [Gammaproteobacteria bacterium]|nr:hypothetical protein [Gammaproteobacteria bacterium]